VIKINLISEGKAARGPGAAPAAGVTEVPSGDLNNKLLVGLAIVGLLIAGGYWFIKSNQLSSVEGIAIEKRAEAQALEKIIKEVEQFKQRKEDLESRIALINDLKKNQKVPVLIMDRISQDLPDLVWLDQMDMQGNRVTLAGRALNPNAVALFVENIKNDTLFGEPNLRGLTRAGPNVYRYDMSFNFVIPEDAEDGQMEPAAAAAR
jgi:type IV pilus assembly protein PilN